MDLLAVLVIMVVLIFRFRFDGRGLEGRLVLALLYISVMNALTEVIKSAPTIYNWFAESPIPSVVWLIIGFGFTWIVLVGTFYGSTCYATMQASSGAGESLEMVERRMQFVNQQISAFKRQAVIALMSVFLGALICFFIGMILFGAAQVSYNELGKPKEFMIHTHNRAGKMVNGSIGKRFVTILSMWVALHFIFTGSCRALLGRAIGRFLLRHLNNVLRLCTFYGFRGVLNILICDDRFGRQNEYRLLRPRSTLHGSLLNACSISPTDSVFQAKDGTQSKQPFFVKCGLLASVYFSSCMIDISDRDFIRCASCPELHHVFVVTKSTCLQAP